MRWFGRQREIERERARILASLGSQTIDMMDGLLATMPPGDPRSALIEEHMQRRLQLVESGVRLALGKANELDALDGVTRRYDSLKTTMEEELSVFGQDAETFVRYLKSAP